MIVGRKPRQAAERHLERATTALINRDFDAFAESFALPCAFVNSRNVEIFETEAALRGCFNTLQRSYTEQNIIAIERRVTHAAFLSEALLLRSHVSKRRAARGPVGMPYSTFSILGRRGRGWALMVSQFSDAMPDLHVGGPDESGDETRSDPVAKEILQNSMDQLARALIAQDFDLWSEHAAAPLLIQTTAGTDTLDSPEPVRARFDAMVRALAGLAATDIVQVVRGARFLGPGLILGSLRNYITASDRLARPSYGSSAILMRKRDGWSLLALLNSPDSPLQT